MGYGSVNAKQYDVLRHAVAASDVIDLGAGDLEVAHLAARAGAKRVLAVDKAEMPAPIDPRVTTLRATFDDRRVHAAASRAEVAIISWPINYGTIGLRALIARVPIVLYRGKNTDGTSCGTPELFQDLVRRNVIAYVPDFTNTLILYGSQIVEREPFGEELAALTSHERMWSFEEVERAARPFQTPGIKGSPRR